jgi:hypothetical protein
VGEIGGRKRKSSHRGHRVKSPAGTEKRDGEERCYLGGHIKITSCLIPATDCLYASKLLFVRRGADFALTVLSHKPRLILAESIF